MTCFEIIKMTGPIIPSSAPKKALAPMMNSSFEASVGSSGINPELKMITQIGVITNQPIVKIFQLLKPFFDFSDFEDFEDFQ